MIKFEKQLEDGREVYYDVLENGFKIYIGSIENLAYIQEEPFIPDHSKSYEENAIMMCTNLCTRKETPIAFTMTEGMYNELQSNIDYLMLLNDPDSATE